MSNYSSNTYSAEEQNHPWSKIAKYINKGDKVLDVGCSSGNLGAYLIEEMGCEVYGIDLDEKDVELAKKRLTNASVLNIETDDIQALGKFDNIIFADVLEHLMDPVATLEKTKKILNPGGSVIFSIPNMAHMGTRLMLLEGRFQYAETGLLDKTHLHYYDQEEVKRIFEEAGFKFKVFSWAERYIPKRALTERLKNIGLTPTKEFYEKAQEVGAVAYEYVGQAVPDAGKSKKAELPFVSPHVRFIEDEIKQIEKSYQDKLKTQEESYEEEIDRLLHEQAGVLSSLSWRVTVPLRLANGIVVKCRQRLRSITFGLQRNPRIDLAHRSDLNAAVRMYEASTRDISIEKLASNKTAVIVHLYYQEAWPLLRDRLKVLERHTKFDLYVTLPKQNTDFKDTITKEFTHAEVIETPNWGRDVLPFLHVCSLIKGAGYTSVLKMHSKKSPHRSDGDDWFKSIVNSLIPSEEHVLREVLKTLDKKETGIIGPEGQYVSLKVNYVANAYFFLKALRRLYEKERTIEIGEGRDQYGFFAGTMFWVRFEALESILDANFNANDFEREKGRIDGTMAHALERVICVVPELDGKSVYEVSDKGLKQLAYKTHNIPEWSELHPSKRKRKRKKRD